MQTTPAATHPDGLGAGWLTDALRGAGALEAERTVTGFASEAVGTGQMSHSYRLTLSYDGESAAPATIIAKLPSEDEGSRAAGQGMQVYRVEISFYREYAARLPIRTPHCYYADINDNDIDFVLLLEDLAPAVQGDQLAGCDLGRAELAVTEAVKLHAPVCNDPALAQLPWLNRSSGEEGGERGALVSMLYPGFRERYAETLSRDILEMGERFMGKLASYYGAERALTSIVHTDYRLDNMLFGTEEGGPPIAIVDWQTASLGDPVGDISYFVGAALQPEERRRHEEALVHLYHERMVAEGVADYDFDTCWRGYRLYSFAGFHMAVLASMLVQRTERGDEMFRVMAERHGRQVLDLDAEALL